MRQPYIKFDVTVEHVSTCSADMLTDHHNRPGEALVGVDVGSGTTWSEVMDELERQSIERVFELDELGRAIGLALDEFRSRKHSNEQFDLSIGGDDTTTAWFLVRWQQIEAPTRADVLDLVESWIQEFCDDCGRSVVHGADILAERIVRELEERDLFVSIEDPLVGEDPPMVEPGPLVYCDYQRSWVFDGKTNACLVTMDRGYGGVYHAIRLCDGDEPARAVDELHDWLAQHGGGDLVWEGGPEGIVITQYCGDPKIKETVTVRPGQWIIYFGDHVKFGGGYGKSVLDTLYTFERVVS